MIFFVSAVNAAFALTLEEAVSESVQNSRKLASAKQAWIAARETVYARASANEHTLTYSGSTSYSKTNSGSGWSATDTYSNKVTLSKSTRAYFLS